MGWWTGYSAVSCSPSYLTKFRLNDGNCRFWLNAIKSTPESVQRRFIDAFQRYSDSVIQQSLDRDHGHQRDIQSYLQLRRYTGGTEPSYPINLIHSNLPDYVLEHPTIKRLEDVATDMIIVANDIYSYNRE